MDNYKYKKIKQWFCKQKEKTLYNKTVVYTKYEVNLTVNLIHLLSK